MPTPKLNLPTINANMTADVVRDFNALAQAVDNSVPSKEEVNRHQVITSTQAPTNQTSGAIWFELGATVGGAEAAIFRNAIVSDDEPEDKGVIWLDE